MGNDPRRVRRASPPPKKRIDAPRASMRRRRLRHDDQAEGMAGAQELARRGLKLGWIYRLIIGELARDHRRDPRIGLDPGQVAEPPAVAIALPLDAFDQRQPGALQLVGPDRMLAQIGRDRSGIAQEAGQRLWPSLDP